MDKEEKILLDDIFDNDKNEGEEEQTPKSVDEIIQKNIEERNKSNNNDKEFITKYNKDNMLSKDNIKSEKTIEDPDLVMQILEDENKKSKEENEKNKIINEQNKKYINIHPNKKKIKLPEIFENNPTPFNFIDFMERDYNKYILEQDRKKYFYLETYQKEGKYIDVKCWKFEQKNSIMNHILKYDKNEFTSEKNETKITCIVANEGLIYIGDDKGVIKIFSLNNEIEIGPLNYKPEELVNISKKKDNNVSVTSMDILNNKNLLACGYYNGIVEIWDLKNKKCKKKLLPSASNHQSQILAVKFLNGNEKMMELISSDCSGLVNITMLTEKIFKLSKNAELNAEVNSLIEYFQPIFVVEILKFTEEEKKMPFLKKNIEIVGFACYDYVFIYQINPDLLELFKFTRPTYFKYYNIADISFGIGYIPRTKDIIDINRDQNQKLNEKAAENCIDSKNLNRLVAVSWDTFINIYVIKYDLENGVERISLVGNFINSCQIKRMFFVRESVLFVYDKKGKFKLLNTGMMTPGENEENKIPVYDENKEKRCLVKELTKIISKVLKQNYIPQSIKKNETQKITEETYYNSIYVNNNNIYILGENELEYGEIYTWEDCVNKLKNDSEWINALIFGLKIYKGEYISYSGVPIDEKKRKEKIREKMRHIIKEYIEDRFKIDKDQINETKYNQIITLCIYISIEFCFEIHSIDFLVNEILPFYRKKNLDKFFYESLEPYIINGNIENQILDEKILAKLIILFTEKKQFQTVGQIIKNLYLSVADSEIVGNRTTKYYTIFTGLITYCSGEMNKDFMLPAREIYSYLQSAKQIPRELYYKIKTINNKKYIYFDYENVVNNTDIDELILSYQYLGSLLLWYINLCLEGYKFPSGKPIEEKKYESLIQQLFLWLINDEVLQRLIEFDSYTLFSIFKKYFIQKQKILEKIEYSDLFKLIKIGDKELQEAKIQKYIEIIFRKASRIDKDSDNIYINDDLYDFICYIATNIQIHEERDEQKNFLYDSLLYIINYEENYKKEEQIEQEIIEKKGDNYIKYTEMKDKYDRYCMHLKRYKENNYILNLTNIIMAAIDNNNDIFSQEDLENILKKAEKTNLSKVKIFLAKKIGNFSKCLDFYLNEFSGEEQIIMIYNFIYNELSKLKDDQQKYAKYKDEILIRITQIASLSIEHLIELTDIIFEGNHALILFKINNNANKLKYLEEIIHKYREDEISPTDPIAKEYTEILKLHIDLLCQLKYYKQILPNLKKRNFYPVDYCLKKCREENILDAWIYLERKNGNISQALKLVTILTKEEFNNLKNFLNDNYEKIIKLEDEQKDNKNDNNIKEEKNIESDEEEDRMSENNNNEEDILFKKKILKEKNNDILRIGIEICENASEILSKKEAQDNWSNLLKMYYELINDIKSNLLKENVKLKVAEELIKKLEYNIGEVIEKMNLYFDLNSVLNLLSEIQGKSFGLKEFKLHLKKLVFSGQSYNYILKSAKSIIKGYVQDMKLPYKNMLLEGKYYYFDKCDFCGKIFKEKGKSPIFFNCGHKFHTECIIFQNGEASCRLCEDYEFIDEYSNYKEDDNDNDNDNDNNNNIISDEHVALRRRNRINTIVRSSSYVNEKGKLKKIKLLNEVNKKYFETSKIFE